MSLEAFIEEAMAQLATDADEVIVDRARALRSNVGPDDATLVREFNDLLAGAVPA